MYDRCCGPVDVDFQVLRELFSELRGDHGGHFGRCCGSACGPQEEVLKPSIFLRGRRIHFYQTEDCYFAYVNATGLDRDKLKLKLSQGRLTVLKAEVAERESSSAPHENWEVVGGYDLPDDVLEDGIFARLEEGELFISLPRVCPESIEIPIEEGASKPESEEKNIE